MVLPKLSKAFEDSVIFAWDMGIRDEIFECDFKIIFNALKGNNDPLVTVANIIKGIQQKLQEFRMVQVCYVR